MQFSVSGGDPETLGSHPTPAVPFPGQLYGATQRLWLARSQHAQRVQQLQEEMAQRVPASRVAKLYQLLEGEQQAAQQLQEEVRVSEDRAGGPAGSDREGEVGSQVPRGEWPDSPPTMWDVYGSHGIQLPLGTGGC